MSTSATQGGYKQKLHGIDKTDIQFLLFLESLQRIKALDGALYKSTFCLLTYLPTSQWARSSKIEHSVIIR